MIGLPSTATSGKSPRPGEEADPLKPAVNHGVRAALEYVPASAWDT